MYTWDSCSPVDRAEGLGSVRSSLNLLLAYSCGNQKQFHYGDGGAPASSGVRHRISSLTLLPIHNVNLKSLLFSVSVFPLMKWKVLALFHLILCTASQSGIKGLTLHWTVICTCKSWAAFYNYLVQTEMTTQGTGEPLPNRATWYYWTGSSSGAHPHNCLDLHQLSIWPTMPCTGAGVAHGRGHGSTV